MHIFMRSSYRKSKFDKNLEILMRITVFLHTQELQLNEDDTFL